MKKTIKICISGYYGFNNFGDEMILKILAENLKKMENQPEITVFSASPGKTAESLGVKSVYTFDYKSVIKEIMRSSCLISGGGSLLQDKSSALSLLYYLFVIAAAGFFRKKTIIFAQGTGPIQNIFLKKLAVLILKHADFITVRDEASLKFLKDNGIKHARLCSDPFWNLEIEKTSEAGKIGVQLRSSDIISDEFLTAAARNINKYYSNKKILILSLQDALDLDVCRKFEAVLKKINPMIQAEVIPNTSNEKIIKDISSLEALIAMRYHACLAGIKAGVRLLPVNYDIKVKTLADKFNLKCINSKDDINAAFEAFEAAQPAVPEDKIQSEKFDFKELCRCIQK